MQIIRLERIMVTICTLNHLILKRADKKHELSVQCIIHRMYVYDFIIICLDRRQER